MIQSQTRTIKGRETSCTQFPAMAALPLVVRLGKIVGPALIQMATASSPEDVKSLLSSDASVLAASAYELFNSMHAPEVVALVRDLLRCTTVVHEGVAIELGGDQQINMAFSGPNLPAILPTLQFVIEFNFGSFFEGVSLPGVAETPEKGSESS